MSKLQQRMILIVAVLICGLTYGLLTWKQNQTKDVALGVDTVSRMMRFSMPNDLLAAKGVAVGAEYLLLSFATDQRNAFLQDHHTIMGGLGKAGSKVLGVQVLLGQDNGTTQWNVGEVGAEFSRILRLSPPDAERAAILHGLRICWNGLGYCRQQAMQQAGSEFLYLIALKDGSVRYYGDQRWGVLALVQDVQSAVGVLGE